MAKVSDQTVDLDRRQIVYSTQGLVTVDSGPKLIHSIIMMKSLSNASGSGFAIRRQQTINATIQMAIYSLVQVTVEIMSTIERLLNFDIKRTRN